VASIARTAATGGDLDPDFLAWSSSLPIDRRLLAVDCQGSIAHVRGLLAAGLLAADEADRLCAALADLAARVGRGDLQLPEGEEDVHMAVESWLRAEVGELAGKLHTGRSRNDQVATDLKLWCRDAVARIEDAIAAVIGAASVWCERHGTVVMPAYTHRQVAVPTLARAWLEGALVEPLRRDRALLEAVRGELATSPLGAGAVGGTTLPIDPAVTAAELGFASGPTHPIDAVGERDHALTLAFVCARIGLHLARLSTDAVELASDGLIALGGAIAGGSSMMPHKRNPDLFELVRGQAALRHGELVALLATFHGLGSGYHRDLQQDKQVLFAAVDGTLDCLRMIAIALGHFAPVPEACTRALREGDAIATDLCEALVERGVPFREAYAAIGALVASTRAAGKRLLDLGDADFAAAGLPAELATRLDLAASAHRRAVR
jgi:argininosuccinate lyase